MSLVNVAAELSQRGRRVLIIDFDLEAPGIPSFQQFSASESREGIVDFVNRYVTTLVAPNISDFIVETHLEVPSGQIPLWVLPAGRRDQSYGSKLSSIDWLDLYENKSGYLLFEDMKQQIANDPRKFDYVLIDSRTGYTDVGGICTRQLADAITFMFFPNKQNISGLKTIVDEIRADRHVDSKRTKMLFCPSNVPDLDDEDAILRSMLDDAGQQLQYETPAATIRHYNSMSLVDQKIFVIDRPKTKLSAEYRQLTEALMELNIEDRDGVLLYLQRVMTEFRAKARRGSKTPPTRSLPLNEIKVQLERISSRHIRDGEICWMMAAIYHDLGDFANELEALECAIKAGFNAQKSYLKRAFILLSQSRRDEAKSDLLEVLGSPDTTPTDLRSVIEALKSFDPDWLALVERSPILDKLLPENVTVVTDALQSDRRAVGISSRLLQKAFFVAQNDGDEDEVLRSSLLLTLISNREFRKAMDIIAADASAILASSDIRDVFNYAIAEWGEEGAPRQELFARVLELASLSDEDEDTNFYQCLALAHAVVGDTASALALIGKAKEMVPMQGTTFSCWTYLTGRRPVTLADLDAMATAFSAGRIEPPVVSQGSKSADKLH
ncbi:MinD-like ATPase involved in chromosome partitioning or flagellar assembly [Rhizobium sp. SG_E_25_P2]|nr:MinD-like ATPase involved in chromosome partitioning or flagellar assembly [Rhizobium sp. SG_E_25_P2]